mmetsp:Transcript_27447/g.43441  ORF Transcript_27447/g.43441 Transcript_27447/m.43441 type:complete len:232 (+) Transcript_27447:390-1085(+)
MDVCFVYVFGIHIIYVHPASVSIDHEIGVNVREHAAVAHSLHKVDAVALCGFVGMHRLERDVVVDESGVRVWFEVVVEIAVQIRNMVASVEVVLHKYLPIAANQISSRVHMDEMSMIVDNKAVLLVEVCHRLQDSCKRIMCIARGRELEKDERVKEHVMRNGQQAIILVFEVLNAVDLRGFRELAVQIVTPSMIRTLQSFALVDASSVGQCQWRCMVTTHIVITTNCMRNL